MTIKLLKTIQKNLPEKPGVYLFLNEKNEALYIGKAKNLKKRTAYYFKDHDLPNRLIRMVKSAIDLKFHITHTEQDAFLLEAQLIKENQPIFNIMYKTGRNLSYLHCTNHQFPRLEIIREWKPGAIGPFLSGEFIRNVLSEIAKIFKLRSCTDYVFSKRKRPCLEFFANRCSAPCVNFISPEEYANQTKELLDFFDGKIGKILKIWHSELKAAIKNEKFEIAAKRRDQIALVESLKIKQKIFFEDVQDLDILIQHENYFYIESIRNKAINKIEYRKYQINPDDNNPISIDEFLLDFYIEEPKYKIIGPEIKNNFFKNYTSKMNKQEQKVYKAAFERMQNLLNEEKNKNQWHEILNLPKLETIEIYDCSHYAGKSARGGMVYWKTDEFIKSNYRIWKLPNKSRNDLEILEDVLTRRKKNQNFPDLIVLDGGMTQLNLALKILVPYSNIIAFAKGENRKGGTVYNKNGKISIDNEKFLFWLESLRSEAHRWVNKSTSKAFAKAFIEDKK